MWACSWELTLAIWQGLGIVVVQAGGVLVTSDETIVQGVGLGIEMGAGVIDLTGLAKRWESGSGQKIGKNAVRLGRLQGNQQSRPEAQDDCPGQGVEFGCGVGWMVKVIKAEQIGLA